MPWKESSVMDERLRFVARLQMSPLCREFRISRKTGYKIFDRYKEHGLEALTDRSRPPVRYANQLPGQIEGLIVSLKRDNLASAVCFVDVEIIYSWASGTFSLVGR